jgi:hypothetical protein
VQRTPARRSNFCTKDFARIVRAGRRKEGNKNALIARRTLEEVQGNAYKSMHREI